MNNVTSVLPVVFCPVDCSTIAGVTAPLGVGWEHATWRLTLGKASPVNSKSERNEAEAFYAHLRSRKWYAFQVTKGHHSPKTHQ